MFRKLVRVSVNCLAVIGFATVAIVTGAIIDGRASMRAPRAHVVKIVKKVNRKVKINGT